MGRMLFDRAQDLRGGGGGRSLIAPMPGAMRPDFLVIGAAKSATTSICHLLARHPEITLSRPKEPSFFSEDANYHRGWSWYARALAGGRADSPSGRGLVGEGSTTYTMRHAYPRAAERIAHALPDVKLVYIVRHPLDRARSHWMERRGGARETLPFDEAVRADPIYLDASRYWHQLEPYRARYPDAAIHLMFFEAFRSDPDAELARLFAFLGARPVAPFVDAGVPRYTSDRKYVDGWLLRAVRRGLPGAPLIRRLIPRRWRRRLTPLVKQPIGAAPPWSETTRRWFEAQVAPDAARLLAWCGRGDDPWQLAQGHRPAPAEPAVHRRAA